MKFFIILSLLVAFIGACSSYQGPRQEEQVRDTFDVPVEVDGVHRDPWSNQPR